MKTLSQLMLEYENACGEYYRILGQASFPNNATRAPYQKMLDAARAIREGYMSQTGKPLEKYKSFRVSGDELEKTLNEWYQKGYKLKFILDAGPNMGWRVVVET